jgi:transcription termination factor Rho
MYDILQLNDMLVPELVDIADQLKIDNASKLAKQDLVYKILDKQALLESAVKNGEASEKPRRKRIIKTTTGNSTEEAEVMGGEHEEAPPIKPAKKSARPVVKKAAKPHGKAKAQEEKDHSC